MATRDVPLSFQQMSAGGEIVSFAAKERELMDTDEARNQLLLVTAALFAVRLFRSPMETHQPQADRDTEAKRSALDAAAIIKAVAEVELD